MSEKTDRRKFLNAGFWGALGIGAASTLEERILLAGLQDEKSQDSRSMPDIAPGSLPRGKICDVSVSRLIIGCNLIAGYAHSRDLLYVSELFKAYNTEAKIFETLELAQHCGIDTMLVSPVVWAPVLKYNKQRSQKIQTLANFQPQSDKTLMRDDIKRSVDNGATLLYAHGQYSDSLVMDGQVDVLGNAIDMVKSQGIPVGVGSHSLEVPIACEKNNLNPDFYVKTFHMDRYWSVTPEENREEWCWYKRISSDHDKYYDNIWCLDAKKTETFMETVEKPWIAFKVMAAGAISPRMALPHAFRHGADFIAAGMFDFQVEDDTRIAIDSLSKVASRKRPWCG